MLLNKLPVLDKGYVAFVDSCNNSGKLKELTLEFMRSADGYSIADIASLTLVIKCPLFVQLNLSKFNLKIITALNQELEAYYPNVGEIGGKDRETNQLIADDIERTTEALLINPKSYQADGCDRFVSQVIMPINSYTTLIVQGSYNEWKRFCGQSNPPAPIKSYAETVKQILDMEWN